MYDILSFSGIYEVFVGHKNFAIGKQPEKLEGTDTVSSIRINSFSHWRQIYTQTLHVWGNVVSPYSVSP